VQGNPPVVPRDSNKAPRRALLIGIQDYLYANPVSFGTPGSGGHNLNHLQDTLSLPQGSFRIPRNQIALLGDCADKGQARAPMKEVIQKTLTSFLATSRAQDHVMVFFVGRAVEAGNEAYLVPIEGELDNPATLLPLKWVYDQLAGCKARQKVLVLDVNRFSPTRGLERPDGGPMGPKFEAAVKAPPDGVQVWAACSAGQHSYETDESPMGAFLEALDRAARRGLENRIQKVDDPLPVEYFKEQVDTLLAAELRPHKLEQVTILAGKEAEGGAPYDKNEPAPPNPVQALAAVPSNKGNEALVRGVLAEVGTPGVKSARDNHDVKYDALPPFDPAALKKYQDDGDKDSALHKAVTKARVLLWAVAGAGEPGDIAAEVGVLRRKLNFKMDGLREDLRAPAPSAENAFKNQIMDNEREVAKVLGRLRESLEELEAAGEMRDAEPKRWQANYDFMKARLEAQIAFLFEYQSMLGQMRKEFPPRDPKLHGGWRLAATANLQGDSTGKKLAKDSRKILDKIAKDHKGTPWEVLAKREKLTALGLEWQPTK
jgi:hypothetical protein